MLHGILTGDSQGFKPITFDHLDKLLSIASDLGFESITYSDINEWQRRNSPCIDSPIIFDFEQLIINNYLHAFRY